MATIKDVAKRAGVSIASVSRYFNNQALLSADKCAAIEDAVQELNYSPSSFGRGLRLSRSGKVLVLRRLCPTLFTKKCFLLLRRKVFIMALPC